MTGPRHTDLDPVAVLDPDGPPGVAFIRSLGARGVPITVYGPTRLAAGRWSRHVQQRSTSPAVLDGAEHLAWLTEEFRSGRIVHVAPTSDYTVYAAAVARERASVIGGPGAVSLEAAWRCLHKPTFDRVAEAAGLAPVAGALPTSVDDAVDAARALGYPVVVKPRTHIGVGLERGGIAHDETELRQIFRPLDVDSGHAEALALDADLAWPMLQQLVTSNDLQVVSVSGCMRTDQAKTHPSSPTSPGSPAGPGIAARTDVSHTSKLAQWPPGLGIGSLFEARPPEPTTSAALAVVAAALGHGLFELELIVDRTTGEAWPIDLNPRAYGQVRLDIARGNDLPGAWYELATGTALEPIPPRDPLPEVWVSALAHHPGALAGLLRGPGRRARFEELRTLRRRPRVGSMFDVRDPLPAIVMSMVMLRHPGGLVRPFLQRS